ncbi:hypothetical protein J437_LFUL010320 [Ladona fulva]|uniref:Sorting nexin-17 n=1 Tax=Ladona fulva TaxID=123851 RepID=A0A8K0KBE3_LADFU|nr:hypothetical protein J437_LFUL010320 [Ladona fulva]
MHFSIPDTEEFSDDSGSTYMGYNLHINGSFHCTVRYRQLHHLHEQLKKEFNTKPLPYFPSKKILPLTPSQLEERRAQLEKYIQTVGQDSIIINSEIFNGFLLCAQYETRKLFECRVGGNWDERDEVELEVFLMNGFKVSLRINSSNCSSKVLEKVSQHIRLPPDLINYFSLFLIKKEEDGQLTILRKLQDFESPYISQKSMNCLTRVVLRKSYWDPAYDDILMRDSVALNLLYVQTVADVERGGWLLRDDCSKWEDAQAMLASLQAKGAKKEYLEAAQRCLRHYGFIHFGTCVCNSPIPGTPATVSIGPREMVLRLLVNGDGGVKECVFKVTRMRCWRITTLHDRKESGRESETSSSSSSTPSSSSSSPSSSGRPMEGKSLQPQLELSFEYLFSRDKLQWVTLMSEQAILISMCLRDVVDELLLKRNEKSVGSERSMGRSGKWTYMRLDGSVVPHPLPVHVHKNGRISGQSGEGKMNSHFSNESSPVSEGAKLPSATPPSRPVTLSPPSVAPVENDAFEGIGDEDL